MVLVLSDSEYSLIRSHLEGEEVIHLNDNPNGRSNCNACRKNKAEYELLLETENSSGALVWALCDPCADITCIVLGNRHGVGEGVLKELLYYRKEATSLHLWSKATTLDAILIGIYAQMGNEIAKRIIHTLIACDPYNFCTKDLVLSLMDQIDAEFDSSAKQ